MGVDTLGQKRVGRVPMRRAFRDWRGSTSLLVIALAAMAVSCAPAGAQAIWTGTSNQDWSNAANWDTNTVPTAATDVVIRHGPAVFPRIDGIAAGANTLVVGPSNGLGKLDIVNGGTLYSTIGTIGQNANGQGLVTVSGSGSSWTTAGGVQVGLAGGGKISVLAGGMLTTDSADLAGLADSAGAVDVDGSVWNNTTGMVIGKGGGGGVQVTNGGTVTSGSIWLAEQATSSYSTLKVDGPGSSVTSANALMVGFRGIGEVTITNGGAISNGAAELGLIAGSEGRVDVKGAGSSWSNSGSLLIGNAGKGILYVSDGAQISSDSASLAVDAGSYADVSVFGTGASWTNVQGMTVGVRGEADLNIEAKGAVSSQYSRIGFEAGSQGRVYVRGTGTSFINSGFVTVGLGGSGYLDINQGGLVQSGGGSIGTDLGATGVVTIAGASSRWLNSQVLIVGNSGGGELEISAGGAASNAAAILGRNATGKGTVTVKGAGSVWTSTDALTIGSAGEGTLNVRGGGRVESTASVLASDAGSLGHVLVTGAGSRWDNSQTLTVGLHGGGDMQLLQGGAASSKGAALGVEAGSNGAVYVNGGGSAWTNAGSISVAVFGQAYLEVLNGASVSSAGASIGVNAGSKGAVIVKEAGSTWTSSAGVVIGGRGEATVSLTNGGRLAVSGDVVIAQQSGSTGKLIIGKDVGDAGAGYLTASRLVFGAGDGSLVFYHDSTDYVFNTKIDGNGTISHRQGSTIYTGNASLFTGTTTVSGGMLRVDGTLGGTTSVQSGGTLGGAGTLTGAVSVANGGSLLGVQGQTLTMGALTLSSGSNTHVSLGVPGGTGVFKVNGNLVLDGTLNVADAGGFGAGVYRIVDYTGSLTDNGLDVGAMPSGTSGTVQTAVAAQVNLVVSGVAGGVQFWNGTTTAADGTIHGGSGVWKTGPTNWTNANGTTTAAWGGNFAIFQSNPGAVTVDGSAGAVSATGMQFIGQGWVVGGAPITLAGNGGSTIIRVGDGTAGGGSHSASISSVLTGSGGLDKTDLGTLILTGANSYAGGTTIAAGTLQLGNGGSSGSIVGNVANSGTLAFNRSDATSFSGTISGSGAVNVLTGSVTLTAANSYSGGTTIANGATLALGAGGSSGSIVGDVANNGRLAFNRSDATSFSGTISGSGAVNVLAGNVTLAAANSYSGGTTIANGATLALGAGGTSGSIAGGVANSGTLAFNRSDAMSFSGTISGSGALRQLGSGKIELTGDSSGFSGTTTVEAGTLAVNGRLGGTISVWTGGRLQGTGTAGDVVVSGTIAPGNSIGTLTVGNIGFKAGSAYEVEVDAAGNSDRIAASGTATIDGGTVRVLAGSGHYAPQTRYTMLTAAGGRTGSFTGVTSNLAFLDPSLSYDANTVFLTMTRNDVSFADVGESGSQIAAGAGVESLGPGNAVFDAVLNLSAPQAQHAFDQLSGEIHASARSVLIEDSRFLRNAVNERMRAAFGGAGAAKNGVVTYVDGRPVVVPATSARLAVWGEALGSWGHSGADGNAASLARKTGGFFIGADAPLPGNWRLGAVAGYSRTDLDVKRRLSSGTSDNYHLGLYGGTAWGDLTLRTGAAYTWHALSTSRSVAFPGFSDRLKGSYDGATAQLFGELAYGFSVGGTRFEPFAGLAYVNLHTDGFTERGGAAALASRSADTDATFTTLGLRASTRFAIGAATLTARGMLGWRHAFGEVTPLSTLRLAGGGGAFAIGGIPIARNAAVVEAGLDYALGPNASLGLSYGAQFGSGASDQSLKANFNMSF